MNNDYILEYHNITENVLAAFVTSYRKQKGWSQQTLADLAGLDIKTIQRAEKGISCGPDARRALAVAFELKDVNYFNKPVPIPDYEKLEKETIKIEIKKIFSGLELREISESTEAAQFTCLVEDASKDAMSIFAKTEDYLKDYLLIRNDLTAFDKLSVNDDLEEYIQSLFEIGYSIGVGKRFVTLKDEDGGDTTKFSVMYCVISLETDFPSIVRVSKDTKLEFC